jgi:hypothetical protein
MSFICRRFGTLCSIFIGGVSGKDVCYCYSYVQTVKGFVIFNDFAAITSYDCLYSSEKRAACFFTVEVLCSGFSESLIRKYQISPLRNTESRSEIVCLRLCC